MNFVFSSQIKPDISQKRIADTLYFHLLDVFNVNTDLSGCQHAFNDYSVGKNLQMKMINEIKRYRQYQNKPAQPKKYSPRMSNMLYRITTYFDDDNFYRLRILTPIISNKTKHRKYQSQYLPQAVLTNVLLFLV